jgi:enamine deaminase RidA (YjgF/YER057c/UK114 family)
MRLLRERARLIEEAREKVSDIIKTDLYLKDIIRKKIKNL